PDVAARPPVLVDEDEAERLPGEAGQVPDVVARPAAVERLQPADGLPVVAGAHLLGDEALVRGEQGDVQAVPLRRAVPGPDGRRGAEQDAGPGRYDERAVQQASAAARAVVAAADAAGQLGPPPRAGGDVEPLAFPAGQRAGGEVEPVGGGR